MDPQWQRVFDPQYKSYYWYNSGTKFSHWEVELEENPDFFEKINKHKQSLECQETQESSIQYVRNVFDETTTNRLNGGHNTNYNINNIEMVNVGSNSATSDMNENDKLLSSPSERARTSANAEIMRRTTLVTASYQICVYVNAVLFEGPVGVLEAGIRCIVFLCVAVSLLLIRCTLKSSLHKLMLDCFRECLISFAAGISLLIPGMACIVYCKYNANDDWDLYPIPSIIGWVDPRRFIVFSIIGGGSIARNVVFNAIRSSEVTNNSLNKPTITRKMILGIIDRENDCQDTFWYKWINDSNHVLLCAPRVMSITFSKIIRGEYSNDILTPY